MIPPGTVTFLDSASHAAAFSAAHASIHHLSQEEVRETNRNNKRTPLLPVLAQIQDKVKAVRRGATSSSGAIDDNVKCVSACAICSCLQLSISLIPCPAAPRRNRPPHAAMMPAAALLSAAASSQLVVILLLVDQPTAGGCALTRVKFVYSAAGTP